MKKNKKILIVASIVLLLLVVGITLFLVFNKKEKQKEEEIEMVTKIPDVVLKDDGVAKYLDGKEVEAKVENESDVFEVLDEVGGYFKIDNPKDVLKIKNTRTSADFTYYRLSQKYNGVDVYGHELIVAVDKDNNVTSITGSYIPIEYVDTYSKISIEDIEAKLPEILGEEVEVFEKNKYVYIKDNIPYYSYVYLTNMEDGVYDVVINAKESIVLDKVYESYAESYTYTGKDIYGNEKTISINDMSIGGYQLHDNGRNISIVNAKNIGADIERKWSNAGNIIAYLVHVGLRQAPAVVDMCDDGTLSTNICITKDDEFIRNSISAMYNFSYVYDYYNEKLGLKSYDGNGAEIYVNIGMVNDLFGSEEYVNAYWSPGVAIFGFGSEDGISLAAYLDTVGHEYTHAVSDNIVDLKYEGESGSLSEAYSDILGNLIEGKNFIHGDSRNGAVRDLTNPNKQGYPSVKGGKYYFPNDTETYDEEFQAKVGEDWKSWDHGGVHKNSTVASHAAFLMYNNGAFESREQMAKVWYNSLYLLSSTSDFEDCALAVIKTAKNFGISDDKIKIIEDAFVTTNMLSRESTSLSGKVSAKNTNKALGGVSVVAINKLNPHVSYTTTTDKSGNYKFAELPMMGYIVTFEKAKYETLEKEITLGKDNNILDVKLTAVKEGDYERSEVVFVLDISKSMDDTDPTDVRKQIMSNIVSSLDSNAEVGLVVFANSGTVFNNGLSNRAVDKKILITDIFNMTNDSGYTDNSGTNGREGLNTGMQLFSKTFDSRKYIVFLTDGEDNRFTGPTYDELIEQANSMNVRILTIGLGEEDQIDSEILEKLAKETNGKYYYANKSTNLYDFDKKIFKELE